MIPLVVAIERGIAQTSVVSAILGLKDCHTDIQMRNGSVLESCTIEGDSPVHAIKCISGSILSKAGHVKSCLNRPGPSGKAKYY